MDEPAATPTTSDVPAPEFRTYASDVAKLTGKPPEKKVKNTPAPTPAVEPPPAVVIPKAPTTTESREDVLARLKARAVPAAPLPEPAPAPVYPNAPSTDEKREEVLARLKAKVAAEKSEPVVRPVATPEFVPPTAVAAPSPIHTYKSDFSDRAKSENASPLTILAAEQNAGTRPVPVAPKKDRRLLVIGSLVLILAGTASLYFAYRFVTGQPPIPQELTVPSLIFADTRTELTGTKDELRDQLVQLENSSLPEGGVAVAYLTYASTTDKGEVRVAAQGGALIAALGMPAPELLLRNIEPASTVGVVNTSGEARPFFILSVSSFERSFAGMLDWEPTIAADLVRFYPPYPEESPFASTSPALNSFRLSFVDEVIENHDVRVLRDAQGRSILLYGYRDKKTLVIARNEAALRELFDRLSSTQSH